ncbi:unnamed protein product [Pleuronectes platessa]|uniref:Uncharacterized protein n=1 Tax=Pleuronectes platessa TaxID=8262 RepID=A0A9N7VP95_PLEPL|nr:unnamed protein product [Pleuronectes platessa]
MLSGLNSFQKRCSGLLLCKPLVNSGLDSDSLKWTPNYRQTLPPPPPPHASRPSCVVSFIKFRWISIAYKLLSCRAHSRPLQASLHHTPDYTENPLTPSSHTLTVRGWEGEWREEEEVGVRCDGCNSTVQVSLCGRCGRRDEGEKVGIVGTVRG